MNRLGLVIAGLLGAGIVLLLQQLLPGYDGKSGMTNESQPLYWVAPMDPGYRRDAPGKSPMGMDLVPVYADQGQLDEAGTVRISPSVVNNLGVRTERATMEQWSESWDGKLDEWQEMDVDGRKEHIMNFMREEYKKVTGFEPVIERR